MIIISYIQGGNQLLNYEVIASGSSGNAVRIENVLVDIGIPFKRLKEHLYEVDYVLITHKHSDHMNKSAFNGIRKMFPHIQFISNWEVAQHIDIDHIVNAGYNFKVGEYDFLPFELEHDVLCYGYCWSKNGKDVIYATDTSTLLNAPKRKFDYLFLESNHDPVKLKMAKPAKGYDPRISGMRHLNTFDSKEFYFVNRKGNDSKWIELHKSNRFY